MCISLAFRINLIYPNNKDDPNVGNNFKIWEDEGKCVICLQAGLEFGIEMDENKVIELSHGGTLQVSYIRSSIRRDYDGLTSRVNFLVKSSNVFTLLNQTYASSLLFSRQQRLKSLS